MKIVSLYIRQILCAIAVLLLSNLTTSAFAQGSSDKQVTRFKKIDHILDIDPDRCYLITIKDSICENNIWYIRRYALSSITRKSKLSAVVVHESTSGSIETNDPELQWKLLPVGEGWQVIAVSNNRYLRADGSNLSTNAKVATNWSISEVGCGMFYLMNPEDARYLATNVVSPEECYFGCYLDGSINSRCVELYVKVSAFDSQGSVVLPTQDCDVLLNCSDSLYTKSVSDSIVSYKRTAYTCEDGLVANDGTVLPLHYKCCGDDSFALYDSAGMPLDEYLAPAHQAYTWHVYNGFITTDDAERRYLVKSADGIGLMTQDELRDTNVEPIGLSIVGTPADSETLDTGCLTLTGAWSAKRLAELDWSGISELNLTAIALPLYLYDFKYRPSDANTIIYLDMASRPDIPQSWHFVVSCGEEGDNRLIRPAVLFDKVDFTVSYPFYAETGMLTYSRQMHDDDGWETLCLPFDFEMPYGVVSAECLSVDKGMLHYEDVDKVKAGTAVLIRKTSINSKQEKYTWTNTAGWVSTVRNTKSPLRGTYLHLQYDASAENVYLLDNTGKTFVRVQVGSSLLPFRAALFTTANNVQQIAPVASGIISLDTEQCHTSIYTIDGKCIGVSVGDIVRRNLPPTPYIQNGKKYIKRK